MLFRSRHRVLLSLERLLPSRGRRTILMSFGLAPMEPWGPSGGMLTPTMATGTHRLPSHHRVLLSLEPLLLYPASLIISMSSGLVPMEPWGPSGGMLKSMGH